MPFRLNAAQQKLYAVAKRQQDEGKPVRIIILKARQLGFSTLTEALLFHACATRANVNALVVAHREDATANLFRMSKLFYDELPAPVKPMLRTSNAQELVFENPSRASRGALPGLRSRFRCATAGGRGIGRSDTLQCVHLSEYAFWPEGGESKAATLAGILQAVPSRPGTMVIMESTANGCEDFKDRWDAAVAGENDFEPVFFAWFENPDYAMPVEPGIEWTAEERETRERYSLSWEQLRWRRWCIANNCGGSRDMFRQEYPANPDEAFLHSGSGVFDNALVIRRREEAASPVRRGRFVPGDKDGESVWQDDDAGEICIYRECEPGHPYVLGGDTAGEGSDWFTAHVIDNSTGEQAASLRRRFSEPEYVRQVYALGRHYNDALVALETNFSTYPVMKLAELGYPTRHSLRAWHRDYLEHGEVRPPKRHREPRFTLEMRQAAVGYYLAYGRSLARTMRRMGYPAGREYLCDWIDELAPGQRKHRGRTRRRALSRLRRRHRRWPSSSPAAEPPRRSPPGTACRARRHTYGAGR